MTAPWMLLFDVGNSRVKWGVLGAAGLEKTGGISHDALREKGFDALTRRLPRDADGALACNVAGTEFGTRLARVVGIHIRGDLRFAKSERRCLGLTNGYTRPRSLGVDRWVALVAAWAEFGRALCVVDAGTAVTIDAVDGEGLHLGGHILPGLDLMAAALDRDTSEVGRAVRRQAGGGEFGNTTRRAVAAGTTAAVCGAVDRAVRTLRSKGLRPRIVLTGGDASRILPLLGKDVRQRPTLVLDGLARIAEHSGFTP